MAADDVRDDLAEELEHAHWCNSNYPGKPGCDCLDYRLRQADALLPVVDRIAREAAGKAWDEGYVAGWRDTEDHPYSDHPSRKTWRPRANPHSAEAADGGGQ